MLAIPQQQTMSPSEGWRTISPRLVAALNLSRALAALYVVAHHVTISRHWEHGVGFVFRFGQEAVIIFFLLSGFLIFANESRRVHTDLKGYYLRRIRRIYPAMLISLVLTALVLAADGRLQHRFTVTGLLATLASLQDLTQFKPGVIAAPFLGNDPLWSLSYEVAFYAVFPLWMVLWRRWGAHATFATITAVSAVSYASYLALPNHFSLVGGYLVMWWSGAWFGWAYRTGRYQLKNLAPALWATGVMCVVTASALAFYPRKTIGEFPVLPFRHFAFSLVVLALAANLTVARTCSRLAFLVATPAAWLASISYGIYVFHYPLLVEWRGSRSVGGFALAAVACVVLSILGDRWLDRTLPKPARPPIPQPVGRVIQDPASEYAVPNT